MFKMIMDLDKKENIQMAMENNERLFQSFDVEFTPDDKNYNKKAIIAAIVSDGKLNVRLGIDKNNKGSLTNYKLKENEVTTIMNQLLV